MNRGTNELQKFKSFENLVPQINNNGLTTEAVNDKNAMRNTIFEKSVPF